MRTMAIAIAASFIVASPAEAHFYSGCKKDECKRHVVKPYRSKLYRIARCESGLRWHLRGNGYEGGFQFSPPTWDATGSKYQAGYLAPKLEQMYRAVIWFKRIGTWVTTAGWPICGHR